MAFRSLNPATGQLIREYDTWDESRIDQALQLTANASPAWAATPMNERSALMRNAAQILKERRVDYARIITQEMGKLYGESLAEVDKCAWVCEYYAEHAKQFLADELIASDAGCSFAAYQPLGTVLAVMPWNFPFWQVMRFAAPGLMAGNTGLLKHASSVPQCALALEKIFRDAGFPPGIFQTLMISASQVKSVIEDSRVHAVTLTGSEPAGRQVAASAGAALKKCVLELGGSDPFVVLGDADLEITVPAAVVSRYANAGQSCIAAKRFIVVDAIAEEFLQRFSASVQALLPGDPMQQETTLAPMVSEALRQELHLQVTDSIQAGATALTGCEPLPGQGTFYQASILDHVKPGMRAYGEELFGPVAIVIRAKDERDALRVANDTRFGLGGAVWTQDSQHGETFARQLQCGCAFVNGLVKSDPRLPFGGVKASGYGRELSLHGIREFVNTKSVWIK